MIALDCAASISFDPNEMMLKIAHADASGVMGELSLLVTVNNLIDLSAMFELAADNILDAAEVTEDDDSDIPF